MREDNNKELRLKDIAIREAIRQEVPVRPQMPKDLNARLMQRVEKEVNRKPKRSVVVWPWIAAACVIGVLMMVFTPPRSADDDALVAESKSEVKVPATTEVTAVKATEPKVETIEKPKAEVRQEPSSRKVMTDKPVETAEEEPVRMSEATRLEIMLASYEEEVPLMNDEEFKEDIIALQKMGQNIIDTWEKN